MIPGKRLPRSLREELHQLLRGAGAASIARFSLTRRDGGLPVRVLLTFRLTLTAPRVVPISCSPYCAPGNQNDLPNTSPGPQHVTIFRGHTRAEERRLKTKVQKALVSAEDELDIALHVEEENLFEQETHVGIEASVEMPIGKIQDLPQPPTTQEKVRRSPFRKAFEKS